MSPIKALKVIVESDIAEMFCAAMMTPPSAMVQSIDQELTQAGLIQRGSLITYVENNDLGKSQITKAMGDSERQIYLATLFPNDKWVCCGRVTGMSRYNVVVAFANAPGA